MIYSLRRRIIRICSVSVTAVFVVIFVLICIFSINQLNTAMDGIIDRIAVKEGASGEGDGAYLAPPDRERFPFSVTGEIQFEPHFFVVRFDPAGEITSVELESESFMTEETAREYAKEAMEA